MAGLKTPFQIVRFSALLIGIFTALAFLVPAAAEAGEWRLAKISGDVRVYGANSTWVKAKTNQVLRPGDSVWTGRRSRALIATEDGSVLLSSRSLVKVPSQALPDSMTVLFQGQGKLKAKVRKKKEHHFSVQTPYLAAVVKGTEFTVDMRSGRTRLSVSEGVVGAVDPVTGQEVDVAGGDSLTASAGGNFGAEQAESRSSRGGKASSHGNDSPGRSEFGHSRAAARGNNGNGGGNGNGNNGNGGGNGNGNNGNGGGNGNGNNGNGVGNGGGSGAGSQGNGNGNSGNGNGNNGNGVGNGGGSGAGSQGNGNGSGGQSN